MQTSENKIQKTLQKLGIEALNEMQLAAVTACESEQDVVLLSPTGSGKTLAFLLPLLSNLDPSVTNVQALILAPSRELAQQIESVFKSLGSGFKVNCCYGGHPISVEKKNLSEPPALLIGTPGRIVDHLERGSFDPRDIKTLILDEFDKSLEFGFQEEMSTAIHYLHGLKKRILTSATESVDIPSFTGVTNPIRLNYLGESKQVQGLTIQLVRSPEKDKLDTLYSLICHLGGHPTLVFCNFREAVERVGGYLAENKIANEMFHGGLEQRDRERSLSKFRNGSCNVFVSTDLAARGLDIPDIKYIIHYHLPVNEEAFIHRNGRTARMKAEGTSFLLLNKDEETPNYFEKAPAEFDLPVRVPAPASPLWITLYIGKGKKDKLSKMDIAGFLLKKGNLQKDEVGIIDVKDFFAYVAVKRNKVDDLLNAIRNEKIKGMKTKIEISD